MQGLKNREIENQLQAECPTDEDHLGMTNTYQGIRKFMAECSTPMTIAIQGDWGIGKTSAMKIIKNLIDRDAPKVEGSEEDAMKSPCIWFNTWQFSALGSNENLFLEFLITFLDELKEMLPANKDIISKSKKIIVNTIKKFFNLVSDGAERWGGALAVAAMVANEGAQAVKKAAEQETEHEVIESKTIIIRNICQEIKCWIDQYLKSYNEANKGRTEHFYIFIDDLDRLEPRIALELLEALKNFMDFDQCVFVLAIDQKVVNLGLSQKYDKAFLEEKSEEKNSDKRTNAEKFFDKIIQTPFRLPYELYNLNEYMESILDDSDIILADEYTALLKNMKIQNPRSIKRYYNLSRLNYCIDSQSDLKETDDLSRLRLKYFAVSILQASFPTLFKGLCEAVSASDYDTQCDNLQKLLDTDIVPVLKIFYDKEEQADTNEAHENMNEIKERMSSAAVNDLIRLLHCSYVDHHSDANNSGYGKVVKQLISDISKKHSADLDMDKFTEKYLIPSDDEITFDFVEVPLNTDNFSFAIYKKNGFIKPWIKVSTSLRNIEEIENKPFFIKIPIENIDEINSLVDQYAYNISNSNKLGIKYIRFFITENMVHYKTYLKPLLERWGYI